MQFSNDPNVWIIYALIFLLGLLVGLFMTAGGRKKWKTRYYDEVDRNRDQQRKCPAQRTAQVEAGNEEHRPGRVRDNREMMEARGRHDQREYHEDADALRGAGVHDGFRVVPGCYLIRSAALSAAPHSFCTRAAFM